MNQLSGRDLGIILVWTREARRLVSRQTGTDYEN